MMLCHSGSFLVLQSLWFVPLSIDKGNIRFLVWHYKFVFIALRSFWENSSRTFRWSSRSPEPFFFGLIFYCMTFLTQLIWIFFIGKAFWCGAFKSLLMVFSSITDSWDGKGWKTDARCSAKPVVFCLSVLAQVLWIIYFGGMWCWGRFIFRVAFHNA